MIKKRSLESSIRKLKPIGKIREYAERAHKQVYLVGGVLRDILLGREVKDVDIAVTGKGEDFTRAIGSYFPLKRDMDEFRVKINGIDVDVLGLGTTEILVDLERRDFTFNAMAYNLMDKRFIDPFNGVKDLEGGIIRALGRKNIVEDPIRIIRGLRFRSYFDFAIEEETMNLFKEYAYRLPESAPERIHMELISIFKGDNSHQAIVPEIFDEIFPGFLHMREIEGGKVTDNLLDHSILTLKMLNDILKDPLLFRQYKRKIEDYLRRKSVGLRLAALLHDIKKPETMELKGDEVHFYGHDRMGGEWFDERGRELKFSYSERDFISQLIKNHMWIHLLAAQKEVTERAMRRMAFRMGEDVIGLSVVTIADQMASTGERDEHLIGICDGIIKYYFDSKKDVERPLLQGRDLINHFDLEPGPIFGRILTQVQNAFEEGEIRTKEEALQYTKKKFIERLDRDKEDNNMR
ncbi:CCA tRNA nucleotidyltransferase [candidate division WOR-3 bacterium]|nr:CCA tRNA nucleotidyltransferase [candidate division WOR-3 bacterium]